MKPKQLTMILLLFAHCTFGQNMVYFENPGFEDWAQYASVPGGWRSCAFNQESPPDIHPVANGRFGVDEVPAQGQTYLGLVVRENGTGESVGQQLSEPLIAGQCYTFSAKICRADTLLSVGRLSGEMDNFDTPAVLRIWGGLSPCGRKELLSVSAPISNHQWSKFSFRINPSENHSWIILEAHFTDDKAYNGNLLLDEVSMLVPINCHDGEPLILKEHTSPPTFDYRKIAVSVPNPEGFFSYQGNGRYLVNLKLAPSESELPLLLRQNCPRIGFRPSSAQMTDPLGLGLKELLVNAEKFKRVLVVSIVAENSHLAKRRKRKVEKLFRTIDVAKSCFRIETLSTLNAKDGACQGEEVGLKFIDK